VFAVTSYDGKVLVSITSCREMMPDPSFFAHCIRESFQELLAIAEKRKGASPLPRVRGSRRRQPGGGGRKQRLKRARAT
jgi:hypothetical protein